MSTSLSPIQREGYVKQEIAKESTITAASSIKAALVFAGTIGSYYLAKTAGIFSYFGWGVKPKQSLGARQIMEVKNAEESLSIRSNVEKVEQASSLSTAQYAQTYQEDSFVEFEEVSIEKLNDLPNRRSISIQNPIQDQNATVGHFFVLTIDGRSVFSSSNSTVFSSNSMLFLEAINLPAWLTSFLLNPNPTFPLNPNPTLIGSYDTLDARGVTLAGNYAYVADVSSGLQIIDITDLANPTFTGSYDTPNYARDIALAGNYAYVADDSSGLQIIDITNPANPTFTGSYNTPDLVQGVALSGNYAYVADWRSGLQIIDISNPAIPTFKGSYNTPGEAQGVTLSGNYAYVADWDSGLQIIDISGPSNPTFTGSYDTPNYARDIALAGNYAYVADGSSGLQIIALYLYKLRFTGTPSSVGTYSVSIRACNEAEECIIDSFDIIVSSDPTDPRPTNSQPTDLATTLIIVGSITGAICTTGICGLSIIGGILVFKRHCNKTLIDDSNISAENQRELVENPEEWPKADSTTSSDDEQSDNEHDLASDGQKELMAPVYEDDSLMFDSLQFKISIRV